MIWNSGTFICTNSSSDQIQRLNKKKTKNNPIKKSVVNFLEEMNKIKIRLMENYLCYKKLMKFLIQNRRYKKIRILLVSFRIQKGFKPTVSRSERIFQISPILHVLKQISWRWAHCTLYFNSAENFDRCGGSGGSGTAGLVGQHAGTD